MKTLFIEPGSPWENGFVEEIPKTSVGKFSKKDIRAQYRGHYLT